MEAIIGGVAYVSIEDISRWCGVSHAQVNYALQMGRIPRPIKLGPSTRLWSLEQVEQIKEYFAGRPRDKRGRPPVRQLLMDV